MEKRKPAHNRTVTETVEFEVRLKNIRELAIDFKVKGASGKAKPDGYDGAVIIWGVRAEPPSKPEDLERHILASRTPATIRVNLKIFYQRIIRMNTNISTGIRIYS